MALQLLPLVGGLIGKRMDRKQAKRDQKAAQAEADRRAAADQAAQDKRIADANALADRRAAEANANADRRTAEANAREDARTAAYNADMDRRTAEANAENERRHARDQAVIDEREAKNREVQLADREAQRAYNEGREANRFVDLRDAAIKAGFNPLTALAGNFLPASEGGYVSSGVGQSLQSYAPLTFNSPMFAQHTTNSHVQADQMFSGVVSAPVIGLNDRSESFGSVISSGMSPIMDHYSGDAARRIEAQNLQNDLIRSQIETDAVVRASGLGGGRAATGGHLSAGYPGVSSYPTPRDVGGSIGGVGADFATDTSDAEVFENRYGDVVSSIVGIGIGIRDIWHNQREPVMQTLNNARELGSRMLAPSVGWMDANAPSMSDLINQPYRYRP